MRKGDIKGSMLLKQDSVTKIKYTDLCKEYLKVLETEGRAEETIRAYKYSNKYFLDFPGQEIYCDEITEETITDYILHLRQDKDIKNAVTINSYLRNIFPTLKYGMKKGYIITEFKVPFCKEQETFKDIYTQDELSILLEKPKEKTFASVRTWTIIWTLASTGIRAKELRQLKVMNVNLLDRIIIVNHTKNKKARYLPISASFALVLGEYLQMRKGNGDDYLFCTVYGEELARTSLQKSIYVYNKSRGVDNIACICLDTHLLQML